MLQHDPWSKLLPPGVLPELPFVLDQIKASRNPNPNPNPNLTTPTLTLTLTLHLTQQRPACGTRSPRRPLRSTSIPRGAHLAAP